MCGLVQCAGSGEHLRREEGVSGGYYYAATNQAHVCVAVSCDRRESVSLCEVMNARRLRA